MSGRRYRRFAFASLITLLLMLVMASIASAEGSHRVSSGETLTGIAYRYGVSVDQLAAANGLSPTSWVYTGQTLNIPGVSSNPAPAPPSSSTGGTYTIRPGDTLYSIAIRHGTSVQALMNLNGLQNPNLIIAGQTLRIPGGSPGNVAPAPAVPAPSNPAVNGEKWIDVNLSTQRITAYEGNTAVYSAIVSTGLPQYPTVTGSYRIYVKLRYTDMQGGSHAAGDYYYLRDVPYTMYFYRGYGIHGTYWHNNFGQPMSHGCVNLTIPDAEWFFNWAEVGTRVVSHY